ncbi:MAG: alanyl-tRNA editing protein [Chloroflexi bacterium]|nr:alanyl-tRNA editing protein [Chloroflexota bacterium]
MTEHLYWQDPYCREFEARILQRLEIAGRPAVILDRTCFYPTSGGQPHDTGTLNGTPVLDVIETQEGAIAHVLECRLGDEAQVLGAIDWARRFDHMQQHTGQHILSRAFEILMFANTVSFHLGAEISTIDLDVGHLDAEDALRVEELANGVVLENRPVSTGEYSRQEATGLPLRKAPKVGETLRVVTVQDFDHCACGGTHVRATGEVGCIHIRGWGRQRDGVRVEFLCGWRAVRDYRARDRWLQAAANSMSVGVEELGQAIERLREAEADARRQAVALRKRLLDLEIPRLAAEAEMISGLQLICRLLDDYDAGNMRYIAQNLIQQPGRIVLLAVREPTPQLCFACSHDVDLDMNLLLREALAPHGGRGGGQPHIAQGGGVDADALGDILAAAQGKLTARR